MYEKAKVRIENSPKLAAYAGFILADWPGGEEHWQWVCEASEDEILEWVEAGSK